MNHRGIKSCHNPNRVAAGSQKLLCREGDLKAFPFLERIHKAYAGKDFEVLGIAQDEPHEAGAFAGEYELSFPIAIDEHPYKTSDEYGLTNVPTIFLIDHDGKILQTLVGFDRNGLIELSQTVAEQLHKSFTAVFTKADQAPDFKPG